MVVLATEKAWSTTYQSGAEELLKDAVIASAAFPAAYSNHIPIIQSTGMGKSRAVDELAKQMWTLPFNLRAKENHDGVYSYL
jgi:hypothetical protein